MEWMVSRKRVSRPGLVLIDFDMPELDGAWLCREMKADKELSSIPVVLPDTMGKARNRVSGSHCGC